MFIQQLGDAILLLTLGLCGWFIMAKLRFPAAEVLGPVALIGTLRALHVDLPLSPPFLFPLAQVIIGIFVGSMLNRQTTKELKKIILPAAIIVSWALSIIFLVGFFLARFTALDLYTAMLSASMGGLPEITIIALASGASITVIVVTQMLRLLGTVFIFPLIISFIEKREKRAGPNAGQETLKKSNRDSHNQAGENKKEPAGIFHMVLTLLNNTFTVQAFARPANMVRMSWKRVIITLVAAGAGGLLFEYLNVPAGLLVGSTVFIAALSVAGFRTSRLSPRLFDLLLVAIGVIIADNISLETVGIFGNWLFITPILIATAAIFATSFVISAVICRLTGWDYPTCFLAAAPGGFTMMTLLAVKHGRDPFKVSMLHLCRLLSINMFLPFLFMYLMSR